MYNSVSSLPPLDLPPLRPGGADAIEAEQGKRPWEMSKSAYLNWAVEQMIARAMESDRNEARGEEGAIASDVGPVSRTVEVTHKVASIDGLKVALGGIPSPEPSGHHHAMDTS